jgi:hypothetical protein
VAITHFGAASVPADNSASNAATQTITVPGSMTTGDLVFVTCSARDAAATFSVGVTGGQTWNALTAQTNTNIATQSFWCRYNGTWSANPRFDFSTSTCNTSVMQVFRPTDTGKLWGVDQAQSITTFTAAATVTITGQTRAQSSAISIAHWVTPDDNSWGTLSGSGWSQTGIGAQYRNTGGNDSSQAYAYNIGTGGSNDVSLTQTANGNDAGIRSIISFYEYDDVTEWSGSGAATLPILTASGTGKRSLKGSARTKDYGCGESSANHRIGRGEESTIRFRRRKPPAPDRSRHWKEVSPRGGRCKSPDSDGIGRWQEGAIGRRRCDAPATRRRRQRQTGA